VLLFVFLNKISNLALFIKHPLDKIGLWMQCLLFVIVGLNWLTISTILLIWLPWTSISPPTWKNFEWKTVPVRW